MPPKITCRPAWGGGGTRALPVEPPLTAVWLYYSIYVIKLPYLLVQPLRLPTIEVAMDNPRRWHTHSIVILVLPQTCICTIYRKRLK